MRLGILELIVIFVIIIFMFGPKQIPKLTSVLTDSFKSFKDGVGKKKDNVEEKTADNESEVK